MCPTPVITSHLPHHNSAVPGPGEQYGNIDGHDSKLSCKGDVVMYAMVQKMWNYSEPKKFGAPFLISNGGEVLK
eukprot:1814159-Ditylum_brightwellii.AAC.2